MSAPGTDPVAEARELVSAYSAALRASDSMSDGTERRILVALVAESAVFAQGYYSTRHADCPEAATSLDRLVTDLTKQDLVGRSLAALNARALAQAKKLAAVAVGSAATPFWLTGALSLAGAVLLRLHAAGEATGEPAGYTAQWVVAVVAAGTVPLIFMLRAAATAADAVTKVASSFARAFGDAQRLVNNLGVNAETTFDREVAPALRRAFGSRIQTPKAAANARGWAQLAAWVGYGFAAIALFYFLSGFTSGAYSGSQQFCEDAPYVRSC